MHKYCGRITANLEQWNDIKKLFFDYNICITGACFEKGKRNENPHFHLLFEHKNKDSYLRKNFFSKHYPKKYSIKYLDPDKLPDMQRYMSKKEFSGDQILLANWDTTKANAQYWEQNDKLLKKQNTITDKLLYHYQYKYKPVSDYRVEKIIKKCSYNPPEPEDIQLYYSNIEYFRTNSKLIPLDHDMRKYIRTLRCMMSQNDDYIDDLALNYFRN